MPIGELSPRAARAAVRDEDRDFDIVDLRPPDFFAAAHIANARLLSPDAIAADPALVGRDRELLLYDGGGTVAARIADFLGRLGYADCSIILGGFPAWRSEGLPVES